MTRIGRLGLSKSTDLIWRHEPFSDPLLFSKGEKGSFGFNSIHTYLRGCKKAQGFDNGPSGHYQCDWQTPKQDPQKQLSGQTSIKGNARARILKFIT